MNERIRLLRNALGLSRVAFGQKLGVSGDVINNLERGRVEIKEPMIKLIFTEYHVSEEWLRTGNGKMFIDDVSSTMQQLKKEYDLNSFDYELIAQYLQLTTDQRKTVCDYFRNVILASDSADSIASSVPDEPPADMDDIDSFTEHRKAAE
ncbi:MAG: helix-turn-helix transcriptional regulator [Clostridia bacterium]|nr:helix-turn-helix transcriptional regulator [Clostridia bacterium]